MAFCCGTFQCAADRQFNRQKAEAELRSRRDSGPGVTTRLLQQGIVAAGMTTGSLIDIGTGVGSLAFGLLARGMTHATAVDASSAYLDVARGEAARLGLSASVQFIQADFVAAASQIAPASIVTLDRVVCCYPDCERLLQAAVDHAERCLALSYPRETWYVRAAMRLENAQRWCARNPFRTFVHPVAMIEQIVRRAGFSLAGRSRTWMWSADVYTRVSAR